MNKNKFILILFILIFSNCNKDVVATPASIYFPYKNGVGSVAATQLIPSVGGLIPIAIDYKSVFDGYNSNSGSIIYYSPLQTNSITISLSQILSPSQVNALPQYAFALVNGAIYMASGLPTIFKEYSQNSTKSVPLAVTPFPLDNRLFVLVGPEPGQIGTDCIVTDVNTKKDLVTFHINNIPFASVFEKITWLSDHLVLCIIRNRNGNVNYFIDTEKQGFVSNKQFDGIDYFSLIDGRLLLYSNGPHHTLISKDFQF